VTRRFCSGKTVTTKDIVDALEKVAGKKVTELIDFTEDPVLRKVVNTWPPYFATDRARKLGLTSDESVDDIVRQYKETYYP
jgi:nucleoside-diphosphate-sugar epimerase